MNIRLLVVRGFDLPFTTLILKGLARLRVEIRAFLTHAQARLISTRKSVALFEGQTPSRLIDARFSSELISRDFLRLQELNDKTLRHEFNLLGSGWVRVRRGMTVTGVEGHSYRPFQPAETPKNVHDTSWLNNETLKIQRPAALAVWDLIASNHATYEPIDWHLDFKSGYRWDPKQWWRAIPHGHLPGVDIKVPWELARMQHLAALALEAQILSDHALLAANERTRRDDLFHEARAQILDFIAQNSPLFGVNWRCAMDVAIRAANWVLTVDLFRAAGLEFDAAFYETFLASLEDHGRFIVANFEKYPDFRANHYLANICGLAFIAVALPENHAKKQSWLNIARNELAKEALYQFHPDGTNFEASTSYHRLSAEMVTFALAALEGEAVRQRADLSFPPEVRDEICARLVRAANFSTYVTKPSGRVVQIGDTDSGRFFKVPMRFEQIDPQKSISAPNGTLELVEDDLDHRDLALAIDGLFLKAISNASSLSSALTQALAQNPLPRPERTSSAISTTDRRETVDHIRRRFESARHRREYVFPIAEKIKADIAIEFPDFGVVIFKAENFFLSFRCGPLGQYGRAGHDHDDQLSIELEVDGRRVVADPGTYLYTPLKNRRNEYRSIRAHFAPQLENGEVTDLEAGLFYLRRVEPGHLVLFESNAVAGHCLRGNSVVWRWIEIESDGVRIRDWSDSAALVDLREQRPVAYSPGYGRRDVRAETR